MGASKTFLLLGTTLGACLGTQLEAQSSGTQIAGTFSIETACGGNASCIHGYRQEQSAIGHEAFDFIAGDVIRAYQHPTLTNVAIATISVIPAGRVGKGAAILFRLGSAAETRIAQMALRSALVEAITPLRREGGRLIASGADKTFRHAADFAKKYGGSASDYEKVSTKTIATFSDGSKYEVHFVRNKETGQIWDIKYKRQGGNR